MKNQRSVEQNTDSPCWHVSRTEVVSVSTKPITNNTESPTLVLTFHPHRLPGPLSMPSHRLLTGRSCYHFQYRQTSWASTLPALPHKLLYISRQNRIFLGSSLPHCVGWFSNCPNHNMFISQAVALVLSPPTSSGSDDWLAYDRPTMTGTLAQLLFFVNIIIIFFINIILFSTVFRPSSSAQHLDCTSSTLHCLKPHCGSNVLTT